MKSRLDKTVWELFFFLSGERERVAALCLCFVSLPKRVEQNVATPACRVHLRRPVQTPNVQKQPEQLKETFFRSQSAPFEASVTQNLSGGTQSKNIFVCFFVFLLLPCGHTRLHIVTLYSNTTCIPCLPSLFPCTDNDCIWSHSFIFYIMIGASICFLGSFLICVLLFWKRFWSVSVFGVRESVCVCTVAYWMCVCVCVWESVWEGE